MQELRTLIEERRIVLVSFDDEVLAAASSQNCCRSSLRSRLPGNPVFVPRFRRSMPASTLSSFSRACPQLQPHLAASEIHHAKAAASIGMEFADPAHTQVPHSRATSHSPQSPGPDVAPDSSRKTAVPPELLSDARKSDIGGYAAASEPVTLNPRAFSIPANDAIAVPQIPIR